MIRERGMADGLRVLGGAVVTGDERVVHGESRRREKGEEQDDERETFHSNLLVVFPACLVRSLRPAGFLV